MTKYLCFQDDEKVYTIISRDTLNKMLNSELLTIDEELFNLENNSEIDVNIKENRINELQEKVNIIYDEYMYLLKKNDQISTNETPTINIFYNMLNDIQFLKENKTLLNNCNLNIILNESDMTTLYHNNNLIFRNSKLSAKYAKSQSVSLKKDYFDENSTIDRYNLNLSPEVEKLLSDINPISISVKECLDGQDKYSLDELKNASNKVEDVVKIINSKKNLSPYEKLYLAFTYVQGYQYNKNKTNDRDVSRSLIAVLNGEYIVCAGKANLLKAICDKIGIPCIYRVAERHAICTIGMNDPKYKIYGIQNIDPTNQKTLVLFNEMNPIFKNQFSHIGWIAELSYRQKDYLIEESGLFDTPASKIKKSADEFRKFDKKAFTTTEVQNIELTLNYIDVIRQNVNSMNNEAKFAYISSMLLNVILQDKNLQRFLNVTNSKISSLSLADNAMMASTASTLANVISDRAVFKMEDSYIQSILEQYKIEPNSESINQALEKFEKILMRLFDDITSSVKKYSVTFNKKHRIEENEIESYIKSPKMTRFIPVDKGVQEMAALLGELRSQHIQNDRQKAEDLVNKFVDENSMV